LTARAPFLTASWRHLALVNYEVDPSLLASRVPRGTELDAWQGHCYLSLVGFLFLDTRVMGVPVPFHRNFEEVNLRFYVRRRAEQGWRRGVVFVAELVPRAAVALVARALYNERYRAVPMSHDLGRAAGAERLESVAYAWRIAGRESRLWLRTASEPAPLAAGSHEEFVAEHYWGYSVQRDGGSCEYRVEHPPWRVAPAVAAGFDGDVSGLYGAELAAALQGPPASAFLADGSAVTVSRGVRIA